MSDAKEQSNAAPLFSWDFVGETEKQQLFSGFQAINKPENREQIRKIHVYRNEIYFSTIDLTENEQRPILVRRVQTDLDQNMHSITQRVIWLVGWQSTIQGKNVKAILELYQNGTAIMKNNDGRV